MYDDGIPPIASGNIADVLRAAAERTPRGAALIGAWGIRTWSELDAAVDAGVIELSRVAPGERVVLALPNGLELCAALFATLRAGLVAVPVDPDGTDIAWVAQRVEASAVVADVAGDAIPGAEVLSSGQVASWWNAAPGEHGEAAARGDEDLALLARASRSGQPVMLSHRAILAAARVVAEAEPVELRPADRVLQVLPLFHVVGIVTAFLPAALAGAAVVVPDPSGAVSRAEAAVTAVRAHRVSVLPAEPTLYRQLDRIDGFERALSTVRLMTSGSSSLDPADFAAIRAATGQSVREGYGISEAAGAVASTLMAPVARPGSAGLPYPGVEVRIGDPGDDDGAAANDAAHPADSGGPEGSVTPASGDAAPEGNTDLTEGITDLVEVTGPGGEVGRIAIRGVTLFSGYWPDGEGGPDADGWFETVDIGYVDDIGELHLVDRAVETITVAGFTVYPREVEDVLVEHPLVADAAVVSVPGRGGETVVAALVAKPGTRPTADDVSDFAAASGLAPFKRPTDYLLVDALPRTEVGRLDRTAVRRRFAEARGISLDEPAPGSVKPPIPLHGRLPGVSRAAGGHRRGAHDTDEDLF